MIQENISSASSLTPDLSRDGSSVSERLTCFTISHCIITDRYNTLNMQRADQFCKRTQKYKVFLPFQTFIMHKLYSTQTCVIFSNFISTLSSTLIPNKYSSTSVPVILAKHVAFKVARGHVFTLGLLVRLKSPPVSLIQHTHLGCFQHLEGFVLYNFWTFIGL